MNGDDNWLRNPGEGKYARRELERRFLVCGEPAVIGPSRRIEDRYLDGTRLRLRRMQVGDDVVFKLTQKVRRDEGDPADIAVTNIYLSPNEYARLCAMPSHVLKKTRHMSSFAGRNFVVDYFHGRLTGLRLAEVEVEDLQAPLPLPAWVGDDVTHDERLSGAYLARAGREEVAAVLKLWHGCDL